MPPVNEFMTKENRFHRRRKRLTVFIATIGFYNSLIQIFLKLSGSLLSP